MMKELPELSVVIPVYNVKDYLQEAVDSVLSQSVLPSEIIIVNDGSTDGSGELAEKLYGDMGCVKIVHTHNQGLGEARNVGTSYAHGDYIYYFDSDDVLVPGFFEKFYTIYAENNDIELFCFSARSFIDPLQAGVSSVEADELPNYQRNITQWFESGEDAFNTLFGLGSFYPNAWLYIVKKSLLDNFGLKFKPIIHEDEEFTPRLFIRAKTVYVCSEEFFKRRVRKGSIMQRAKNKENIVGYLHAMQSLNEVKLNLAKKEETIINIERKNRTTLLFILILIKENGIVLQGNEALNLKELVSKYLYKDPQVTLLYYSYPMYSLVRALKNLILRR